MARKQAVTRTVKGTVARCAAVKLSDKSFVDIDVKLPRTLDTSKSDKVRAYIANNTPTGYAVIQVNELVEVERTYGMLEEVFLMYAVELDNETRKPLSGSWTKDDTEGVTEDDTDVVTEG